MPTALTSKGQVTIPKHIRDALHLEPGTLVTFSVNSEGEVVLHAADVRKNEGDKPADRFDVVRGSADVKWRTDELMKLLRSDD